MFHCIDIPDLRIPFSGDGHLSCFHVSAIMGNAAINMNVKAFVWTRVFTPLRYIPRRRISGSYGNSILAI